MSRKIENNRFRIREKSLTVLTAAIFLGSVLCLFTEAKAAPVKYALKAGKILTVTQGVINHGIILIENGRIRAVGPGSEINIPADYEIIDAHNQWVTPGMVEIHSHIGAASFGDINDMVLPVNPELRMVDTLDKNSWETKQALAAGITTIHLIPGSGTNQAGFGVIYKPFSDTDTPAVVRPLGAFKVSQAYNPERRGGDLGQTRMGMSWILRDLINKSRLYNHERQKEQTDKKKKSDPAWDSTRDVVQNKIPVLIHTASAKDVMATARIFHDEFALGTIVSHATFDGYKVAGEMAQRNVHVNVGPRQIDYSFSRDKKFYGLAQEYKAAGVKNLSINTDAPVVPQEELFYQVAMAVRHGLDESTALEAVTINPARAVAIDHRVGSIETGKDADLIIKAGRLFDVTIPVDIVLVNGHIAYRRTTK